MQTIRVGKEVAILARVCPLRLLRADKTFTGLMRHSRSKELRTGFRGGVLRSEAMIITRGCGTIDKTVCIAGASL